MSVESINATGGSAVQQQQATQQAEQNQKVEQAQAQQAQAKQADSQKLTVEEMQAVVDKLNEFMANGQRNLNFSVDKDTDNVVVKVMDTQTEEIIRQFPSEETLKLAKHIEGMLGLIFNDKA